jgi:hypothetical protein
LCSDSHFACKVKALHKSFNINTSLLIMFFALFFCIHTSLRFKFICVCCSVSFLLCSRSLGSHSKKPQQRCSLILFRPAAAAMAQHKNCHFKKKYFCHFSSSPLIMAAAPALLWVISTEWLLPKRPRSIGQFAFHKERRC